MIVNMLMRVVSLALLLSLSATAQAQKHLTLLNVSYLDNVTLANPQLWERRIA